MKFTTDLGEVKKALAAMGKAVKKISIEPALIKMEALEDSLRLSLNGTVGVQISIPAKVSEQGCFVTSFSSANILTVRHCNSTLNGKSIDENTLLLTYNGGKAKTVLTKSNATFVDIPKPQAEYPQVELQTEAVKKLAKDTLFAACEDTNDMLHAVKLDIADDEEGILKFVLTAADRRSIAKRTAYAAKNGTYTGSTVLLPEQVKITMDMLDNDGNLTIAFGDGKVFFSQESIMICFQELARKYPNIDSIIQQMNQPFSFKVDKKELLDVLNSVLYLQGAAGSVGSSLTLQFTDDAVTISYTGNTEYIETLPATITGTFNAPVYFSATMLKEIVTICPNQEVVIGGENPMHPFWMTCGENQEYLYCLMPINPNFQKNQ